MTVLMMSFLDNCEHSTILKCTNYVNITLLCIIIISFLIESRWRREQYLSVQRKGD